MTDVLHQVFVPARQQTLSKISLAWLAVRYDIDDDVSYAGTYIAELFKLLKQTGK